jgi:hypothetical protein
MEEVKIHGILIAKLKIRAKGRIIIITIKRKDILIIRKSLRAENLR